MTPEIYRLLHVAGVLLLFLGLGGVLFVGDGQKPGKLPMILHGLGLLVMVVAGVGTVHKDGAVDWGNWLYAKIGCWVLLAVMPVLIKKGILPRAIAWLFVLAIGATAVWLAQTKPF